MLKIEDVFSDLPQLETERLILRKITSHDAQDMFEYASDPEVSKHTTWEAHHTIDTTNKVLQAYIQRYEKHEVCEWGIVYKDNQKFIGTCGYGVWIPPHQRAEIAYGLSRHYWGKGLMTEAIHEVLRFGFATMDLNRVEARCFVENIGSERVMQKVGMNLEGTLRQQMYAKGKYRDLKLYAILREDYTNRI
jgi:ribosomal-protein-alanine N-acetyltransferase